MLMATKSAIDFHRVLPQHQAIHVRLENWGRWCNGTGAPSVSPMFRLYRAPARSRGAEASWSGTPMDGADAKRLARFMGMIPERQRKALAWCYVKPVSPKRMAQELDVTLEHLSCLVHEGREQLLILRA
jgi:DNA-directed RNA polymerase specialized sigma24 family protein